MNHTNKNFCFCTLALGDKYRLMVKQLALDLEKFSPDTLLIVGTDKISDFKNCSNVSAFKQHQTGVLKCYSDKRFVIEKALEKFDSAIFIDADTRIVRNIPNSLKYYPGITATHRNLIQHINKYGNRNLEIFQELAAKLNVKMEDSKWIGDSLFIVTKDNGKEKEFLRTWGLISKYLELKGIHSGVGRMMGLACQKVGFNIENSEDWKSVKRNTKHLDASDNKYQKSFSFWKNFKYRLGYHYRLNKARLSSLKNFNFYYRS